jgi:poly(3-hydroxybutyrate) depolymerase
VKKVLRVATLGAMLVGGFVFVRRRVQREQTEVPDVPVLTFAPIVEHRSVSASRSYLSVHAQGASTGPLVLVIHGDTGSAESVRDYTGFDRAVLAQQPAATVAYLQADGKYWNLRRTEEELSYMSSVVLDARSVGPLFVFGWSSGAYLAQKFACTEPRVKAIALSGGRNAVTCERNVATLVLHNTGDKAHTIEQGDALVASMRAHRECREGGQATLLSPCVRYEGCLAPLTYCRVEGGTHRPWRSSARVSWDFFSMFAREH